MRLVHSHRRSAATTLETAIIRPPHHYEHDCNHDHCVGCVPLPGVAYLSREGARYASCHGAQFRKDAEWPIGTSADGSNDIMKNCIQNRTIIRDASKLTMQAIWPAVVNQPDKPDNWPSSKVKVTITYTWVPEINVFGTVTFTSTSELPITN